jgi:hypothetical protein
MKIVLTDATLEKIMLRYIRDIIKVNSEPIEDGDKLEYFDQDGNLFIRVDRSFPPTVNLLFSYDFYIKMYQYLKTHPDDYHRILKSVLEQFTKLKVDEVIPSEMGVSYY